ncbi:MAG: laccase domain-containing protein, partial [Sphaerotilus sp.]|nr:laccase domain-containing protein [Sphaerotilus sp.]
MPRPEPVPAPIDTAWPADWLRPVFSSPRVGAVMTTRAGGVSQAPWDSLNLRDEVGDDPLAVRENRARLHAAIGRPSVLLAQVHGAEVCLLEDLPPGAEQAPGGRPSGRQTSAPWTCASSTLGRPIAACSRA